MKRDTKPDLYLVPTSKDPMTNAAKWVVFVVIFACSIFVVLVLGGIWFALENMAGGKPL